MPGRIFGIFRALGLILAVAMGALWIRGRFVYDVAIFTAPHHVYCELCVIADQIRLSTVTRWPKKVDLHCSHERGAYPGFAIGQRAVYRGWFPLGISITGGGTFVLSEPFAPAANRPNPLRVRYTLIAVPIPLLVLLAVLPSAGSILISRWRKRRLSNRQNEGLCPTCGYDLRGSADRCPECGAVVTTRSAPGQPLVAVWIMVVTVLVAECRSADASDSRLKPPDQAVLKAKTEAIHDLFKQDFDAARTAPQRLALADKLISTADDESDSADRFVLLSAARVLAADSGDLARADVAIGKISAAFDVDTVELEESAIESVSKAPTNTVQKVAAAEAAADLFDRAVANDHFAAAEKFSNMVQTEARAANDAALLRYGKDLSARAHELSRAYADVNSALQALSTDQNDVAANLKAGEFFCFIKGDWDRGLPMLARGNDLGLSQLAHKELAAPDESDEKLQIADSWWLIAQHQTGKSRIEIRRHAARWYIDAAHDRTGLRKELVEKKAGEAEVYLADLPATEVRTLAGGFKTNEPLEVGGKRYERSITTHPTESPAHAAFNIGPLQCERLITTVILKAPDEGDKRIGLPPLIFRVVGDGIELWHSRPITRAWEQQHCDIDVSGRRKLELIVEDGGNTWFAWAFWLDPVLICR